MAAIFLAPIQYPASALAGDTTANQPLANLWNDYLAMTWQSSVTAPYITVNVTGTPINSVVLWGTNLTGSDTVRVRVGPNASGASPVFDQTFTAAANVLAFLPSVVTTGYVRLDFTRGSGAAFTEMSRLIVGRRIEADGISKDAEVTYDDQSIRSSGPNWMIFDEYSIQKTWKVKIEGITEDQFFAAGAWDDFIMAVGEKRPFIFIPYYPSTYTSRLVSFGAMNSTPRVTFMTQVDRNIELSFQTIT